MKLLRVVYLVVLVVSISAAAMFYYQYRLKDREITEYQKLERISGDFMRKVHTRLAQSKRDLEQALQEIETLAANIAVLKEENLHFRSELQALKKEGESLQERVAGLSEEKAALENRTFSLQELKKLIKIAKIEIKIDRLQRRLAKIVMFKKLDEIALQQGNRGYLLKEGVSTFKPGTKVSVELEPLKK